MQYPQKLIPKVSYKQIAVESGALDDFFLIRHTKDKELIDPITQKLKRAYVGEQTYPLRDISVNLLGGDFDVCDIFIEHDRKDPNFGYFNYDIWQEGESITNIPSEEYIFENTTRGYYFLRIGDLSSKTIPYEDDAKTQCKGNIKVLHTPTRRNFWHCSLRTFSHEGDLEPLTEKEIKKSIWRKHLLATLRAIIIENAIVDENFVQIGKINSALYTTK